MCVVFGLGLDRAVRMLLAEEAGYISGSIWEALDAVADHQELPII